MNLQQLILSEQLAGLTKSFSSLSSFRSLESRASENITKNFLSLKQLNAYTESMENSIQAHIDLSQSLVSECDLVAHLKGVILKSEEKLLKPYKALIQSLRTELDLMTLTCSDLKEKNSTLELRVFNFLQEIEKHKRNTRLSLIFSDPTEKICGACQKIFKPNENFNWSCKHHRVRILNNSWFCCGKHGQMAEGCVVGKHISVEELEEREYVKVQGSLFCVVRVR